MQAGFDSQVVFVTAFDQYAIDAFEVNAVDYLLKPVEPARLAAAIERARKRQAVAPKPVEAREAGMPPIWSAWSRCWPTGRGAGNSWRSRSRSGFSWSRRTRWSTPRSRTTKSGL